MSDVWEKQFNNNELFAPAFLPGDDKDGDGQSNLEEAVAGTDPLHSNPPVGHFIQSIRHVPATWLEVPGEEPVLVTPEAFEIEWHALEGKKYILHASFDLTNGSWHSVGNPVIGNGAIEMVGCYPEQEGGGLAEKVFWKVGVEDIDTDSDSLTNHEESIIGTSPNLAQTFAGIPDVWAYAHGLSQAGNTASSPFQGGPTTNLQAYQQGVQANPNATINNRDGDELDNDLDAVPDDIEINWGITPERQYVWIEQMTTPTASYGLAVPPVAVNSSGQILFAGYTAGQYDSSTDPPKNALWDSSIRQWLDLPASGSQIIQADTDCSITVTDQAGGFIDINDAGTVSALGRGQASTYPPTVGAHWIKRTQPTMIWEKNAVAVSGYGTPKYYIYHPDHPKHPDPPSPEDTSYRDGCWSELDLSIHFGALYHWKSWRAPGGRIGIDGSTNLIAHLSGSGYILGPVWLLRDGTSASPKLDQEIRQLPSPLGLNYGSTFPGAILDKNRALFFEATEGETTANLWLKDGATVETIAAITTPLNIAENDITHAPIDDTERLWIAAGNKILLEKRAGGSGPARWHEPPSMGEAAIRMNARGEAITATKLWRNGTYTNLNDVAAKPNGVEITQAIDIASNGIILVQAVEGGVSKTGILIPVEVVPDEDESGKTGDLIPSNNGAVGEKHYVSPKKTIEIPDDFVVLKAAGVEQDRFVELLEWEGGEAHPTDPMKRHVSRDAAVKTLVRIKVKQGGAEAAKMNVWVVWAIAQPRVGTIKPLPDPDWFEYRIGDEEDKNWRFKFTIQPAGIITEADRPALHGNANLQQNVPGHNKPYPTDPNPILIADTAVNKWDVSRQMSISLRNPGLITKAQLGEHFLGQWTDGQPHNLHTPVPYPVNPVEGNDDPYPDDEENNPYAASNQLGLEHQIGEITSFDAPGWSALNSWGTANDQEFVAMNNFREFARVQLWDGKRANGKFWFRISNYGLWHHSLKAKFDLPTGKWNDNGSSSALGNIAP